MSEVTIGNMRQQRDVEGLGPFDVALGYCSADMRSVQNLIAVQSLAIRKIVFTAEPSTEQRSRRSAFHLRKVKAYEARRWCEQTPEALAVLLKQAGTPKDLSVFLDVSAFPRTALATLLQVLREFSERGVRVQLTLGYCLASYSPPPTGPSAPNRRVAPVHRAMAGWPQSPGLPVTLIVGLGYERGKALGAVEYIQPADLRMFVPHSPEERYLDQVRTQNKDLLAATSEFDCFDYAVLDPAMLFATLSSLVGGVVQTSKPVLLPFGPKVFFAVSLLLALQFPELAIWHVSGEEDQQAPSKRPSEHSVFLQCVINTADSQRA